MWRFKKGIIRVYCNFPRFILADDRDFLYKALEQDLIKEFGNCYKIEVYGDMPDNVIIHKSRKSNVKDRAIRINIYKRISNFK